MRNKGDLMRVRNKRERIRRRRRRLGLNPLNLLTPVRFADNSLMLYLNKTLVMKPLKK